MGNCCSATTSDVAVLNDMLHHLEEQIEDVRKVLRNSDAMIGGGGDVVVHEREYDLWKKLSDMEHERELLRARIVEATNKYPPRYGPSSRRRHWEATAAITATDDVNEQAVKKTTAKRTPPFRKRRTRRWKVTSKWTMLGRNRHNRVPSYVCLHPVMNINNMNDMMDADDDDDDGSDTSYFSTVSQLNDDDYSEEIITSAAANDDDENQYDYAYFPSLSWWNTFDFWPSCFVVWGQKSSDITARLPPLRTGIPCDSMNVV